MLDACFLFCYVFVKLKKKKNPWTKNIMVFISKRCVSLISLFHTCGFAQCCAGAVGETHVKVSGHWARVFPSLPLQTATTLFSWHVQQRHALVQDLHDCQRCQHQIRSGLQSVLVLQGGHWQSLPCFKPQAYSYCSGRKWEKSCVRLSVCLSISLHPWAVM